MAIRIKQDSTYSSNGWWNWSVWLDGPKEELDRIKHVVYTLHPTFIEPVQTAKSRRTNFKLSASGWGEFQIHIDIVGRDGKVSKRKHWLHLEGAAKSGKRALPQQEPAAVAPKPKAFLSFGVADAPIADAVREGLTAGGFEVSSPSDVARSIPVERAVDEMLQRANVSVFVVSGRPSPWQSQEMTRAVTAKRGTIVPVLVGTDTQVPPQLQAFKAVYVTDAANAREVATDMAQRAMKSGLT